MLIFVDTNAFVDADLIWLMLLLQMLLLPVLFWQVEVGIQVSSHLEWGNPQVSTFRLLCIVATQGRCYAALVLERVASC